MSTTLRPTQLTIGVILACSLTLAEAGGIKIKAPKIKIGPPKIELPRVGGDIGKTLGHVGKEADRGLKNAEEGVRVAGKTIERQAHSVGDAGEAAGRRLREGKIVDAVWHFHTDYYKSTESNYLKAMQESSMLRMGGQTLSTIALGPGGTAAFNAWYVGRTTKDVGQGLKAGVISGASGYASGAISQGPVNGFGDAAARAGASGAVSGTAAVASGGKFEEGFQHGALASAANSAYQAYTGAKPDPRAGEEWVAKGDATTCAEAGCATVETSDDMRNLSPRLKHTGKFTPDLDKVPNWKHEGSGVMNAANHIPYVNAGSYAHDMWAIDWKMSDAVSMATIPPAMVATGIAGGAGRDAALLKTATEKAQERVDAR